VVIKHTRHMKVQTCVFCSVHPFYSSDAYAYRWLSETSCQV